MRDAHQHKMRGMHSFSPRPGMPQAFLPRHSSMLLLLLIVIVEGVVVRFVIRDLRAAGHEVETMYASSVRGLRRIGSLQYDAQETRRSTLYALSTSDSNLQIEYADQSREADRRVSAAIAECLDQSGLAGEIDAAQRLQRDWKAYLNARDEVLASILEGSTKEAVGFDLTQGVPRFDRVRRDLDEIQRLYDQEASQDLADLDLLARGSVFRLVGVLVCTVFLVSVFVWVLQKNRMTSAMQFARLQIDFAASVSHELRTPLTVLCSAVDNVADGLVTRKDQVDKYVAVIRNQSRQIDSLVTQVLLFAASQDGKGRFAMRPIAVRDIIESALANTSELIQRAGFVLEKHIDPGLPLVLGDAIALSHCLQNLITNALKYGEKGRWIRIDASCHLTKTATKYKKEICISVSDHGNGIERSEMRRIFEPFYRSPAVIERQIHGTGLGLPIAKSLAEAMGGRLSVSSELGAGSVFTACFPVIEEANELEEEQEGVALQ
jgi:signal transduction histidine kinase